MASEELLYGQDHIKSNESENVNEEERPDKDSDDNSTY